MRCTIAKSGSAASNRGQASSIAASSPSSVLPATTSRSPAASLFNWTVASASSTARTSNLRFPATETRSARQPMAFSRSPSVSLCASTRLSSSRNGLHKPAQPPVTRPGAVRDAGIHHGYGDFPAKASAQQVRPELRLRQHQQPRLQSLQISPHCPRQVKRAIKNTLRPKALTGKLLACAGGRGNYQLVPGKAPSSSLTSRLTASTSPTETA